MAGSFAHGTSSDTASSLTIVNFAPSQVGIISSGSRTSNAAKRLLEMPGPCGKRSVTIVSACLSLWLCASLGFHVPEQRNPRPVYGL